MHNMPNYGQGPGMPQQGQQYGNASNQQQWYNQQQQQQQQGYYPPQMANGEGVFLLFLGIHSDAAVFGDCS